jgi:hypothetical protein
MLRRDHFGVRRLYLEERSDPHRPPERPGVAEPGEVRGLPRTLRLVAVEEAGLETHGPPAGADDHHRALQHLGPMMVDGITEHRAVHRIVAAERHESLPHGYGQLAGAPLVERLPYGAHLVHVGVGVSAVHEPLAHRTGRQHPAGNGGALETDRGRQRDAPARQGRPRHERREVEGKIVGRQARAAGQHDPP